MKIRQRAKPAAAFSALELLVVIVTVLLVAVVFTRILPFGRSHARASRINCVNNLKQTGLAARMWSNDHEEHFPWTLSTNKEGTLEYAASPEVFRHFLVMSNELASPMVLVCPEDRERLRAVTFTTPLANSNISYFIGLDADETRPQTILSGDRNIIGGVSNGAWLVFRATNTPSWTREIHQHVGNIGLGDGSVQQVTTQFLARQFQAALASQTNPIIRLAIPRTPGDRISAGPFLGISMAQVLAVVALLAVVAVWLVVRRGLLAAAMDAPPEGRAPPNELGDSTRPR